MEDTAGTQVVNKDDLEQGGGERVTHTNTTYPAFLIKTSEHINKDMYINIVQQYVINNSEIFTGLGIFMHIIAMQCVKEENTTLPQNFS